MQWYVETVSPKSDRKGPINPATGWPTFHPSLITEAATEQEARDYFEQKFPGDVLAVFPL